MMKIGLLLVWRLIVVVVPHHEGSPCTPAHTASRLGPASSLFVDHFKYDSYIIKHSEIILVFQI